LKKLSRDLAAARNWPEVLKYAKDIRDGKKIACIETRQMVERFFRDLENKDYDFNPAGQSSASGSSSRPLNISRENVLTERR
jgi:phage terminase large subunit-like protein